MAMHKSAKKRIRRNGRKALENKSRISETRTQLKKVEAAISFQSGFVANLGTIQALVNKEDVIYPGHGKSFDSRQINWSFY